MWWASRYPCFDTFKATGPDGIGPKLLYEAGSAVVPSLTKLLKLCFSSSKVPQTRKHANVMPLFKSLQQFVVSALQY